MVKKMKLNNLVNCFESAIKNNAIYVAVKIEMYGFEESEIIINPKANFEQKLKYYINAYNEDLTLKNAPDKIKIVGFTYGNCLQNIGADLL